MVAASLMSLEFTPIFREGLCIGSRPAPGHHVREAGFDVLVLCAHEIQLPASHFPGVEVLYVPLEDDASQPVSIKTWARVTGCAKRVAWRVKAGKRVLVTCAQGMNRSGIVMAAAVHYLTGYSGAHTAGYVSRRRVRGGMNALFNQAFVKALTDGLPDVRQAPRSPA